MSEVVGTLVSSYRHWNGSSTCELSINIIVIMWYIFRVTSLTKYILQHQGWFMTQLIEYKQSLQLQLRRFWLNRFDFCQLFFFLSMFDMFVLLVVSTRASVFCKGAYLREKRSALYFYITKEILICYMTTLLFYKL